MPLKSGRTDTVIAKNIKVLRREGKPAPQAKAIAMSKAGRAKPKRTIATGDY